MLNRWIVAAFCGVILSAPAAAAERGSVWLELHSDVRVPIPWYDVWLYHMGQPYAVGIGWIGIAKVVPFTGSGHFLIPAPDRYVFHYEQTVAFWDGVVHMMWEEGKGYTDVFRHDTELGEIAAMRSGNFLVAERWNDPAHGAKLIEFNLHGRVAEYLFPEVLDVANHRALGAMHIELLADQCTVLYTLGNDDPASNRVRRLNICTRQPQNDFASLLPGEYAGSIRQLPNGDVLVANGSVVLQFTANGSLVRSYQFPGVTHLALSTDGRTFWAAGVNLAHTDLRQFGVNMPDANPPSLPLGNPEMRTLIVPLEVNDLVVIGEWRAATAPMKVRPRAVRH